MKKPVKPSFTSLRIIGEKAQKLLAKAKQMNESHPMKQGVKLPPPAKQDEILVHLSIGSIVKATLAILAVGIGVIMLYMLADKIILLLLGIFIATIIDPSVQTMQRWGIPRIIAVLLDYFIALFLIVFLLVSLIPIIAEQIQQIAVLINDQTNVFLKNPEVHFPFLTSDVNTRLTVFVQSTLQNLNITKITDALTQFGQNLNTAAQGSLIFAAQIAGSLVNFVLQAITVFVLAFFLQLEKEKIISWLRGFLSMHYRSYVDDKSEMIHYKLAQWARGQLLLCLSIAILVFIALWILGMPYALTLAILAGFTEFIPVVGPLIAAIPSVLIAVTAKGLLWGVVVAVVYYVIQWCENNLLVPLIMKRAVGLSPIAILFAIMVGISFPTLIHPILGVMLSVPVTSIISIFLEDLREMRTKR